MSKPHVLYRMFDADNQLLYIGLTNNPKGRFGNHSIKTWWEHVATITVENFVTRQELIAAERAAIQAEKPMHNIIHNQEVLAAQAEAEADAEEELEDRLMGIALARLISEESYGITRTPVEATQAYAQFVREARDVVEAQ